MSVKTLMSAEDIRRSLARITHEIIERNGTSNSLILAGIHTRGVPIAKRISLLINNFSRSIIPVITLNIEPYRDDTLAPDKHYCCLNDRTHLIANEKTIILIDDVLYTGRSVRAAMDALIGLGRPREVQLAVLIDRGHREMPIRADYIGKNIPSSRNEIIKVRVAEIDGLDEVVIVGSQQAKTVIFEIGTLP